MKYEDSLENLSPKIASEWHPTKNGLLKPADVRNRSQKKVWWLGKCNHEWEATIINRTAKKGTNCPYCTGKKVSLETCLGVLNPNLAKEWHPTKNEEKTPYEITVGSSKKVWWLCKKDSRHEWLAAVSHRNNGRGCPYCSGAKVLKEESFAAIYPELVKEIDLKKNKAVDPYSLSVNSNKKISWKCKEGHEWKTSVSKRTYYKTGCPYCSGRKINEGAENSLYKQYPDLMKEWHPTKNEQVNPKKLATRSNKKVWWRCEKGHEWRTNVAHRTNEKHSTNCPECNKSHQTSFPEQVVYYFLNLSTRRKVENRIEKYGHEFDVYVPSLKLAIEYDGVRYHSEKEAIIRDEQKNEVCKEKGVKLIRIREKGCPSIKTHGSVVFECVYRDFETLEKIIKTIIQKWIPNAKKIEINIEKEQMKIFSELNTVPFEKSVASDLRLGKEWDKEKNKLLTAEQVMKGSRVKVWWVCRNCSYEWQQCVYQRKSATNCPSCSKKERIKKQKETLLKKNGSLFEKNPMLAKEWHPRKNKKLTPEDVTANSKEKVWWLGKCKHEWEASITNRNKGRGCPYCSNQKVDKKNSIVNTHPHLIKEWNYEENKNYSPYEITSGSDKKVAWKCGNGHKWSANVYSRAKMNTGCRVCTNNRRKI